MRNYLVNFFNEFEYDNRDSGFLLGVYDKITENNTSKLLWYDAISAYEKGTVDNYDADILSKARDAAEIINVHPWSAELLIFMCMTRHLKEIYLERGLDMQIYRDSVLDLKWKLNECKTVKGVCGSFVAGWFIGFFTLSRFALGRLQFEITKARYDYDQNGIKLIKDETPLINVHIPRTETPLDKESCDKAYAMARKMFRDRVGDDAMFVCSSWLLFPMNKEILPSYTNTYRFMSEYEIIASGYNLGQDLWRLFDTDEVNPERLPADTTFRKCYRDHLLGGGRVGWGYGIKK